MQAEHRKQLEEQGILSKIQERFPLDQIDRAKIWIEATDYASPVWGEDDPENEMLAGSRRLSVVHYESGEEDTFAFVGTIPVAYVKDGALAAAKGFSVEDAELVKRLAEGLEQARDLGVLPYLTPDLTKIGDRPPAGT